MSDFLVRPARFEDLDALVDLLDILNEHQSPKATKVAAEQAWTDISSSPNRHLLVAESESLVVGTLDLVIVPNLGRGAKPWAVVENVIVGMSARRQGIGTALMQRAIEISVKAGCYKIQLTTDRTNTSAHEFYESLGLEHRSAGFKRYF